LHGIGRLNDTPDFGSKQVPDLRISFEWEIAKAGKDGFYSGSINAKAQIKQKRNKE
jgi:hypothetical protein